jgi:hypothetical protein
MDPAEPNLDPEIEETNDSDSKDARLNPADYVVCIIILLYYIRIYFNREYLLTNKFSSKIGLVEN